MPADLRDLVIVNKVVYYLPGHGGRLGAGLGEGLLHRGWQVAGRETVDEFRSLEFKDQVEIVAEDICTHFWHKDACVVANSFGAYLFLHALAELPPYPGRALILSPILGEFSDDAHGRHFVPPRAEKIRQLAEAGEFPQLKNAQIHVGELDWQSMPASVVRFGELVKVPVTVVPGAGHVLGKEYIGKLLDEWLV